MAAVNQSGTASISVGRDLAEVAERLRRSTVEVRAAGSGRGSGVIWRPNGVIVTNAHVATLPAHDIKLRDGRVFWAELVRRDAQHDLAVLRIDARGLPSAISRDASSLRTGEVVLAVGNPFGEAGAFTVGLVSAVPEPGGLLVRADIRLAPGNSGGPLADAVGRIVGVNSMIVNGHGIAVTSAAVERLLALPEEVRLGVTVQSVRARVQQASARGLLVVELEPGGAAHLAGVLVGDVIVRVNGAALGSPGQLANALRGSRDSVSLQLLRGGHLLAWEVRLRQERAAEAM